MSDQLNFYLLAAIRCGLTQDGDIEAVYRLDTSKHMTVDRRSGAVILSAVKEGTDDFRRLVRAAREHVA